MHCEHNPRLFSPPPEIASLGAQATIQYLLSAAQNGKYNTSIQLIAVGNGESGKTSVCEGVWVCVCLCVCG